MHFYYKAFFYVLAISIGYIVYQKSFSANYFLQKFTFLLIITIYTSCDLCDLYKIRSFAVKNAQKLIIKPLFQPRSCPAPRGYPFFELFRSETSHQIFALTTGKPMGGWRQNNSIDKLQQSYGISSLLLFCYQTALHCNYNAFKYSIPPLSLVVHLASN